MSLSSEVWKPACDTFPLKREWLTESFQMHDFRVLVEYSLLFTFSIYFNFLAPVSVTLVTEKTL